MATPYILAMARIQDHLDGLMKLLPMAHATGRIDEWSVHYTKGYLLKLRVMK